MSDFDKEAEREKLRKKYERDEQERKATQRMSDLLLKGATMTNSHCGTCGDPLFQQEGTTFCPSCHGNPDAVQGTGLEAQPAEEMGDETTPTGDTADGTETGAQAETADASGSEADDASTAAASSQRRTASSADDSSGAEPDADSSTATIDVDTTSSSGDASPSSSSRETRSDAERSRTPSESVARDASGGPTDGRSSGERRAPARSSTPPADGDLEAAHASLVRAVEKFAEKAAATDDPRYARECLEAAREAGEALETLR